jgi:hypothetical protein
MLLRCQTWNWKLQGLIPWYNCQSVPFVLLVCLRKVCLLSKEATEKLETMMFVFFYASELLVPDQWHSWHAPGTKLKY